MSARRVLPGGLAAAAVVAAALAGASSALANGSSTNATWAGAVPVAGASNDPGYLWSNGGANGLNWSGGSVPGTTLNVLSFPDLPSCDVAAPTTACYTSYDDLGAIDVNQLSFGGSASTAQSYNIYADAGANSSIKIDGSGGVGLTGTPPTGSSNLELASFGIPIILNSSQQWNISGNNPPYGGGILYLNTISGAPNSLALNLTDQATVQANSVETGPVTVTGNGTLQLNYNQGSGEKLPAVSLTQPNSALVVASPGATSGTITLSSTGNQFYILTDGIGGAGQAPTEATLATTGDVNLSGSTAEFDIDGNNTSAGANASELTATGTVNFNGSTISLWQAQDAGKCDALTPGNTYTLVSANALAGSITVGGTTVSKGGSATETLQSNTVSNCTNAPNTTVIVSYNANTITATIAGAPAASGQGPQITGTATVGDKLTVSNNGSWTGGPAPTFSYQWESCSGSSCAKISGATASSYTLRAAEAGKTVKVQVTATNHYGSASAFSNSLGPVKASTTSSGSGGGGGGGGTTVTRSLRRLIRHDLARIAHPHGRRALLSLLRRHVYRARFHAPAAGTLSIVWKTTVRVGHGHHARRHTYVVARGVAHARRGRNVLIRIGLTRAGRRLLREHPFGLRVAASERFLVRGLGWTSFTRRFKI